MHEWVLSYDGVPMFMEGQWRVDLVLFTKAKGQPNAIITTLQMFAELKRIRM